MMRYTNAHSKTCGICEGTFSLSGRHEVCNVCARLHDYQSRATKYLEKTGSPTPRQADVDRVTGWFMQLDKR